MTAFNPDKLFVELREGVTVTEPVFHRRYTLTHSDLAGELFLTIGLGFAKDKINPSKDEVLGEWTLFNGILVYNAYLDVDGLTNDPAASIKRNEIFRRELPLALTAIRFGDKQFFFAHPELNACPILVSFLSAYPQLNTVENWGSFSDYAMFD
ncbi:staygreen family protein [Virgibacillus sp. LDC-1]|uniref:staygreen family protein n=1 Tax=Virgibacillus sp. LDC-1 TaxID=3039856 RepID=UPI0024DEBE91|nr:staygreen family protein [Virgibacillus sp. LDC-1]